MKVPDTVESLYAHVNAVITRISQRLEEVEKRLRELDKGGKPEEPRQPSGILGGR